MISLSIGMTAYTQCEIEGITGEMCLEGAPAELSVEAPGAVFDGPGISGNFFNPVDAGIGTHEITVSAPGEGYTMEPGVFAPIDISGGGATTVTLGDDQVSSALPIGFTFNFFGNDYSNFYISSNGFMTFAAGSPNGCCSGQNLPTGSAPNNLIAFAWEDLDPGNGGAPAVNLIRYETVGAAPDRILVMEFYNVDHFSSGFNVTSQVHLKETSNCVEIHTTTMPSDGGLHTMGIENASGTEAYPVPGRNRSNWSVTDDMYSFCPNAGCEGSLIVEVIEGPEVNATVSESEICSGEEITLNVTGTADEYTFGAGIEPGVPFTPGSEGLNVFIISGLDVETGCLSTDAVEVVVSPAPAVSGGENKTVCEDEEFVLMGIGDEATYVWDMGVVDGEPLMQEPGAVTYTVTGTNSYGCESSSEITVYSNEVPTGTGEVTMMTGMGYDGEIDFTPSGGTGGPYTFLWSNGATTEDINALTVGTYTVIVSDGMCDSEVTFIVDSQASIEKNELENLKVYPNPVVDFVMIEFEGQFEWSLFDNQGKVINAGKSVDNESISLAELSKGTYILNVHSEGKVSVIPLVKE